MTFRETRLFHLAKTRNIEATLLAPQRNKAPTIIYRAFNQVGVVINGDSGSPETT
jgi:hypothetical protein